MRFIVNFIFFGILFYLLWLYFPEAFQTLVSWANHVVTFIKNVALDLWEKYGTGKVPAQPSPASSLFFLFSGILKHF